MVWLTYLLGNFNLMSCSRVFRDMLTDWAIPRTCSLNSVHMKEDSLVKLALKKARTQSLLHNHSRKGKFALEMSSHRSPNSDEHVTTTSIKKEGQTYEVSLDCIGRAREVHFSDISFFKYLS